MIKVAIVGNGQLAIGVAAALARRNDISLSGPTSRMEQAAALAMGADVVVIATATRLAEVSGAIEIAITAGSQVIVSAEECAYPWAVDPETSNRLDALARAAGVTVLGCGLNPGLIFDALVLTLAGAVLDPRQIEVIRTVDVSGFGAAVRGRLGLGVDEMTFRSGVERGDILGHSGFPQSISLVANAMGITLDRIDTVIEPILEDDVTVGVRQIYTGIASDAAWYRATFVGHLAPTAHGLHPRDEIHVGGINPVTCVLDPGIGSQAGSQAMIAHSIDRVIDAPPGWLTVSDLPPAHPVLATQ